ncbi:MAG: hypothetical protein Q9182_007282 [Xanthomendoza sp. 2 TL-2023]
MVAQACNESGDVEISTSISKRLSRVPYDFHFPTIESPSIAQDAELVDVTFPADAEGTSQTKRIRFHDYQAIYSHQGLYESLFHRRLECQSPQTLVSLLGQCIHPSSKEPLSVLEIGAGNGVVAEELRTQLGSVIGRLVGTDIFPESRDAVVRDRPQVYDDYLVGDLLQPDTELSSLGPASFGALIVCAALGPGWGDLPVQAMLRATEYLVDDGLVAITLNVKWLSDEPTDSSTWNDLIGQLKEGEIKSWSGLTEVRKQKYHHRRDMRGNWISYYAIVLRKKKVT